MKTVAVGTACLLAGLAIGAGAIAIAGDDDAAAPAAMRARHGLDADDLKDDRHGDVLVFLVEDVSDGDRQAIEAALEADEDVEAYEYWNAEASQAEARRLFRNDPDMLEKLDGDFQVPTSYRLLLRDPSRPNATIVTSRLEDLPGVLEVVITDAVPDLGD